MHGTAKRTIRAVHHRIATFSAVRLPSWLLHPLPFNRRLDPHSTVIFFALDPLLSITYSSAALPDPPPGLYPSSINPSAELRMIAVCDPIAARYPSGV